MRRRANGYRRALKDLLGRRTRFTAVLRRNRRLRRIILLDVQDSETGLQVTDHLWLHEGKWSSPIPPRSTVAFNARVVPYFKGRGPVKSLDYKLERPTQVAVLKLFRPARFRKSASGGSRVEGSSRGRPRAVNPSWSSRL